MRSGIAIENLSVYRQGQPVLHDLNFDLVRNKFVGIIGPNGSGKSTLLASLAGVLPITAGSIFIDGKNSTGLGNHERARLVSYLPQARPVHWAMTATEIVRLGRYAWGNPNRIFGKNAKEYDLKDTKIIDQAINDMQADHLRDRGMHTLSGGEQARIHLARVLAGDTPYLFADEPTHALDAGHQFSIMERLRKRASENCLILTAIHDFSLAARYCDELLVLDQGHLVVQGPPKEVLTPNLLSKVFNVGGHFAGNGHDDTFIVTPRGV